VAIEIEFAVLKPTEGRWQNLKRFLPSAPLVGENGKIVRGTVTTYVNGILS
jgi:hypothetical protein